MANPQHVEWLKEGAGKWNARREAAYLHAEGQPFEHTGVTQPDETLLTPNLQDADLRGADLQEADLQEADLRGADLNRAKLLEANLREAILRGAKLFEADLRGAKLNEADLFGAVLRGAILRGAKLFEARLRDADLIGAKLFEADLRGADLNGADLRGADLNRANLIKADLRGANLFGANLFGAILIGANLSEANLRGARLREAILSDANLREAILRGADLREAKLFKADLRGADLNGADLRGADLSSVKRQRSANDGSRWRFTNLTFSHGLTQDRLNEAIGDTGVILPEGLVHPDHWPELEDEGPKEPEAAEEAIESRPTFVFLSYSHEDRASVDQIHPLLLEQDMPIWWDVDILPGQNWAAEIKQHLDDAAAVLVLWTKNSVKSDSVVEEARQAQSRGALVHARMDDAELPYGFSETQYADLRNWNGTADHPEMKKLLQALRDKLSPPGSKEIGDRLVSNSSIGTQIENGKVSFADTPVGVEPPMHNPDELAARIEGQIDTAEDLIEQNQEYESNAVPENFEFLINRYKNKLSSDKPNWFNLNNSMEVIKKLLSRENYREAWEESLADLCDLLIAGHSGLEPFIRPEQLPEDSPERKPDAPDPIISRTNDIPFAEGAEQLEFVVSSEETSEVLDEQASEALQEQAQELNENFAEFKNPTDTKDNKGGPLRRSIKKVAAYVAVTIGAIASGIATSVLTAPEAAKTLMANLQTFLDLLLKLF